jgi:hypothetical protein
MKPSHCLALLALLPLGCGSAAPVAAEPAVGAPAQRPTNVTVVDLSPPAPAPVTTAVAKAEQAPMSPEDIAAARKKAAEFGMIGLISGGDPDGSPAATGNMWGSPIGDSFGAGGLGLAGTGTGGGQGTGVGIGHLGGSATTSPKVQAGATAVIGTLPPEVIQRVVRQSFGRFRLCYEDGLRANPKLEGKVAVHFVIEKDGAVSGASLVQGTDLADKNVASCVSRAFTTLVFPKPDGGGKVIVTYPIKFAPGDAAAAQPAVKAPPAPKSP